MFRYRGERQGRADANKLIGGTVRILRALDRGISQSARRRERNAAGRWAVILIVLLGLAASWLIAGRLMSRSEVQQAPSTQPTR